MGVQVGDDDLLFLPRIAFNYFFRNGRRSRVRASFLNIRGSRRSRFFARDERAGLLRGVISRHDYRRTLLID